MKTIYVLINPTNGIFDKNFPTKKEAQNFIKKNNCGYYCIMTFIQAKNWLKKLNKKVVKMSFEISLGMNH